MTLVAFGLGISPGAGGSGAFPVDTILITDPSPVFNTLDRITVTSGQDVVSISDEELLTLNLGGDLKIYISDDVVELVVGDPSP